VLKPVLWVGSSRRDLKTFPQAIQRHIGQALYAAQCGEEYPSVKALKGFGGRTVLEIVASHESDTYRTVYTVRFYGTVYVLHAFSEEVQERYRHTAERNRAYPPTPRRGGTGLQRQAELR